MVNSFVSLNVLYKQDTPKAADESVVWEGVPTYYKQVLKLESFEDSEMKAYVFNLEEMAETSARLTSTRLVFQQVKKMLSTYDFPHLTPQKRKAILQDYQDCKIDHLYLEDGDIFVLEYSQKKEYYMVQDFVISHFMSRYSPVLGM